MTDETAMANAVVREEIEKLTTGKPDSELPAALKSIATLLERYNLRTESKLVRALVYHSGSAAGAARQLRVSVTLVKNRIGALGLSSLAEKLRALGHVKGGRPSLEGGRLDPEAEKAAIIAALDKYDWRPHASDALEKVAEELGYKRRTLYTLMARYKIRDHRDAQRKKALIKELKAARGTKSTAAAALRLPGYPEGITRQTLDQWMEEFDLRIADYF